MSLENVYYISQIGAAFAVACSLIFVGMQLRQSEKTQRAMMHQAVAQRSMEALRHYYSDENGRILAKMINKSRDIEPFESMKILGLLRVSASNLSDAIWQQKVGLISEAVIAGMVKSARLLYATPGARVAMDLFRDAFPEDHLQLIDEFLLKDATVQGLTSITENWNASYDRLFAIPTP